MKDDVKYIHRTDVHNLQAANKVVPLLIDMFRPASVLDVGCGIGTWLRAFSNSGVKDIMGIDGNYVDRNLLMQFIDKSQFQAFDLINGFDLGRKFDLVISLEVAEHLPETSADEFVKSLCNHGDTIVFSAAIPGQGGQNHLNEQWHEYWMNKFFSYGYQMFDFLRPAIWKMTEVDWWYKQNMFIFSAKNLNHIQKKEAFLEIIHPEHLQQKLEYITYLMAYVKDLETKIYELEKGKIYTPST